jgi:hypothetical protein
MTQRFPSLLCLDTILIGNPMTSLSALTVINPQAIPFVVFVGAFLRFLTTDSPSHECAVSLLLSVKSLRLLFTCAIGWVSIDSLNANIDFINERFFVFRGKLLL